MNNVLVMREEELEEFVGGMKNANSQFDSTAQDIPKRLGYMKRSNLFSGGIDKISRQTNSISNSILNIGWMMQEHNRSFFGMERNLASIADKIEIPANYTINDNLEINNFSSVTLEKNDGRSINEGKELKEIDEVKDSIIKQEQKLADITSSLETREEKIDESTIIKHENLGNINNSNSLREEKIDENTNIQKNTLNDINNDNTQNVQNIDNSTNITNRILGNINENNLLNKQNLSFNDESLNNSSNSSTNDINNTIDKINSYDQMLKSFGDMNTNNNGKGM